MQPGAATRVRTWAPKAGHIHGFLITHSEAISISDYYTVREGEQAVYRPTCHYSYHPSDSAVMSIHEFAGGNSAGPAGSSALLLNEILPGGTWTSWAFSSAGHARNAYWYGSQLSIDEARRAGAV
jgi:homospermidine synthase